MKKKILTIVLTAVLLLSIATLGISTVFRVESVTLVANLTPQSGVSAEGLQAVLEEEYEKESIFFTDNKKAKAVVAKQSPYLRVTGFKKSYPNTITIIVTQDVETYAVEAEGGYYVLNTDGVIIQFRKNATTEENGSPNVLIKGVNVSGKVGGGLSGDFAWDAMLTLCRTVDAELVGIRRNVATAEVFTRTPDCIYILTMREGVKIYVDDPSLFTEEKAKAAVEKYLSLTDAQRMTGRITVRDIQGQVAARYDATV